MELAAYWVLRLAAALDLAGAETPTPTPGAGIDPNDVSPGVLGFLATFALVAMVIPLAISMNRRLRRSRYRAVKEEQADLDSGDDTGA